MQKFNSALSSSTRNLTPANLQKSENNQFSVPKTFYLKGEFIATSPSEATVT